MKISGVELEKPMELFYNYTLYGGISIRTILQIFNTNVKSVLLYACETWKVTQ
jgi:hypothetical protein